MQITKFKVNDFRNIEETEAEFAPLTIIRGHNHQGKSSVGQAIQLALTGRTRGTSADGKSANDKIREGAKKARIYLDLKGKSGPMPFEVTYGPNKEGRQIKTDNPAGFLTFLQKNNERLSCALDSEYFIKARPEEQKSILAALVLPTSYEFPQDKIELARQFLSANICDWKGNPLVTIDNCYSQAFERRKLAKAELNGVRIPQVPATKPKNRTDEIRMKLTDLRGQAAGLRVAAPGNEELGRLKEQNNQSGGRLFTAEAGAEDLRTAMSDVDSDILAAAQLKTYERIANNRRLYDSLEAQAQEIARQIEDQRNVAGIYQDLLAEKKCPTCSQAITDEFVKARVADAETIIRSMGVKQNDVMRQQRELGNIEEAEKLVQAHKDAIGQKDTFARQLADHVSTITKEKELQRDLKAKIIAAQGQAEDANKPNPALDELNNEIAGWEAALSPAITYEATIQQIEQDSARSRELTTKVEALEKLVAYFGKDGVKATLINQNIAGFSETVNKVLSVWGYSAVLSIEPYSFEVTHDGRTLPLKELSGSEELMFGVALQTAIAHHGKIGVVLIDKVDTFINSERNKFYQALFTLIQVGLLEQAIAIVADDSTEVKKPKEGVVFYAAQAGKLVKL